MAPPRIADPRKNKRAETLIADFLPAYLFTGPETNENNAAIPIVIVTFEDMLLKNKHMFLKTF